MHFNPYVNFYGRCEEALEFYKAALGGSYEIVMRAKDMPQSDEHQTPAGWENKVLHSRFSFDGGEFLASDGQAGTTRPADSAISLCAQTKSADEAKRIYAKLSEGGEIDMPMQETFWSPAFGMFTDKFGIYWMIGTFSEASVPSAN